MELKPRLHDTTCCRTGLTTGCNYRVYKDSTGCQTGVTTGCIVYTAGCQTSCTTRFDNRLNKQLFVHHSCQTGFDNRLNICLHDTPSCQTGCTTGFVKPVVSCKRGIKALTPTRRDHALNVILPWFTSATPNRRHPSPLTPALQC